jgi:hypothetical protein
MRRLVIVLLFMGVLAVPAATQDGDDQLPPFGSVVGNLPAGGAESWTFNAVGGEVLSLVLEATSEVDPVLVVLSETGAVLVSQDDYDYPNSRDAVIQSVTVPFTGTYTAQVRAYGATAGSYRLTRLRGFADGADLNGFIGEGAWASPNPNAGVSLVDDRLTVSVAGIGEDAISFNEGGTRRTDYFAQVEVEVVRGRGGWTAYLIFHQQSADTYYRYALRDDGLWQVARVQNGEITALRDWITHPAIVPGQTDFTLGVLANGIGYDLYYNGNRLGQVVDDVLDGGVIGMGLRTGESIDAETELNFANLRITVPATTADGADPLPERVVISGAAEMAHALELRRVIPAGGELALNVPESSTQSVQTGVSRLGLGRGSTFTNFVLSTEVTLNIGNPNGVNGCGLFLRATDDTNYILAFIDQTGGYGLAARDGNGFQPGVFGEQPDLGRGEHHLLITANGDQLHYYIDGGYVGSITAETVEGTVGNAVVNYDPNLTVCSFQNTWLWSWEPVG